MTTNRRTEFLEEFEALLAKHKVEIELEEVFCNYYTETTIVADFAWIEGETECPKEINFGKWIYAEGVGEKLKGE